MEGVLNVLSLVSNLIVGAAFLVAGTLKLRNGDMFRRALAVHHYLPQPARVALWRVLPPAEIVLGAVLVSGLAPTAAGPVAAVVLLVFLAASFIASRATGALDCGCFGPVLGAITMGGLVSRNAGLALIALLPAATGFSPAPEVHLVAVGAIALAGLAFWRLRQDPAQTDQLIQPTTSTSRRDFLRRTAGVAVAAVGVTSLGSLLKVNPAEAACSYCGSCSQEIIWISCTGNCCAAFWVRNRKYCDGYCYSCSGWWVEEHCGEWECC